MTLALYQIVQVTTLIKLITNQKIGGTKNEKYSQGDQYKTFLVFTVT